MAGCQNRRKGGIRGKQLKKKIGSEGIKDIEDVKIYVGVTGGYRRQDLNEGEKRACSGAPASKQCFGTCNYVAHNILYIPSITVINRALTSPSPFGVY